MARLYRHISELFAIEAGECRLRARKIETGSLLMDLLGDPKVMGVLSGLITGVAGLLYGRYTREGRLKQFPEQVNAVECALALRERLAAAGIDTSRIDTQLQACGESTAQDLTRLLSKQNAFRVNDVFFERREPMWSGDFEFEDRPRLPSGPNRHLSLPPASPKGTMEGG